MENKENKIIIKKNNKKNTIKITEEHVTTQPPEPIQVIDCPICIEKYNNSTHKRIKCEYCIFEACKECCQTYLLIENTPKCMNNDCDREWTPEFISNHFTKKFVNIDLKSHFEKVLFDKQRALMPSTQPIIENILKEEEYMRKITDAANIVKKAKDKMYEIQIEFNEFRNRSKNNTENRATFIRACPVEQCKGFLSSQWKCGLCQNWTCPTCHEVKGLVRDCEHTCNPDNVATANLLNSDTKPCPKCGEGIFKIDGCFAPDTPILMWDGSIKMSQNIALGDILVGDDGTQRTVLRLMEGQDDMYEVQQNNGMNYTVNSKHTLVLKYSGIYEGYNDETIEIFVDDFYKLQELDNKINKKLFGYKTSNNTLSCIQLIKIGKGKYYGWEIDKNHRFLLSDTTVVMNCSQMFCVICHTAFCWRTGKVETVIHNPHYFEWMRRNGTLERNPNDIQCGREITHNTIVALRTNLIIYEKKFDDNAIKIHTLLKTITEYCRKIIHIRYVSLNTYTYNSDAIIERLRIQYMRNYITENFFKTCLQRENKKGNKYREIVEVLHLLINTVTDIVYNFIDELKSNEWIYNLERVDEINKIIEYADECFMKISRTYDSVPLTFKRL